MIVTKNVCVVIVLYNCDETINNKVRYLQNLVGRVLLVDNGSKSELNLEGLCNDRVSVIRNSKNEGIAYALNQGLEYAYNQGFELLLTLDQDSYIEKDTIELLAASIDLQSRVISVGPFYDNNIREKSQNVKCLITSGNMLHVNTIKSLGGFVNELFIDCVDIDLSFNIISHGYVLQKIAGTMLEHKIGEYEYSNILKVRYLSHKPIRFFYKYRNNFYIYRKYKKRLPKECLKLFLSLVLETLKVIFVERNKFQKCKYACKGMWQGVGIHEWNNNVD